MQKFCTYCGKTTENGICTCEDFKNASRVNENNPDTSQQSQSFSSQEMKKKTSDQYEKSKNFITSFIKDPIGMMTVSAQSNDFINSVIFGVIHFIILYLYTYLIIENSEISFKIGLTLIGISVITSIITFIIGKKYSTDLKFKNVLSIYFIATIPTSMILILAILLGFYIPIKIAVTVISFLAWIITCYIATKETIKANQSFVFWLYFLILLIVLIVGSFVVKEVGGDILSNMFDFFDLGYFK